MTSAAEFSPTPRTQVRRLRERGVYDRETVYAILDEGLVCHAACTVDGTVWMIPTAYGRDGDRLLLHGAAAISDPNNVASVEAPAYLAQPRRWASAP